MNKILFSVSLSFLFAASVSAQVKWDDYSLSSSHIGYTPVDSPYLSIAMQLNVNYLSATNMRSSLYDSLIGNNSFTSSRSIQIQYYKMYDTSAVYFFLNDAYLRSLDDYEFRVLENGTNTIVPWSKPEIVAEKNINWVQVSAKSGYLGGYHITPDKFLMVDLKRKDADSIISTIIVNYEKIVPRLSNIYPTDDFPAFIKKITENNYQYPLDSQEVNKWKQKYSADELDTLTHLPKKLILEPSENNVIFYLNIFIQSKKALEYQLVRNGDNYKDWQANDFDRGFIWLKNLPPGDYTLKIRYTVQPENVLDYPFEIKKAWQQTTAFKIAAGSLIAAFFGFIFLLFRLRKQKLIAAKENLNKTKLSLELQSLQSQLNPHFVFNALSSIQGLINTNRIADANQYLSNFGTLLRSSLDNNANEFTTLDKEIGTLNTYLKLEQLRFNFQYTIQTDDAIHTTETEFPSLLLQPIIENAIKHGVAAMDRQGRIEVTFIKNQNDIFVTVVDNGNGFTMPGNKNGYGTKLTKERIKIINQLYDSRQISMQITSDVNKGTSVQFIFKNWLL